MESNLMSVVKPSLWVLTARKNRVSFEEGSLVAGIYATREQAERALTRRYSEAVAECGEVDIPDLFRIIAVPYYEPFQTLPASIASGELSATIKGAYL